MLQNRESAPSKEVEERLKQLREKADKERKRNV